MMKKEGSASGSISQRHGSPDPDPHKNIMDPQYCSYLYSFCKRRVSKSVPIRFVLPDPETNQGSENPEPVFLNVYGAQESIPRNEFRQPM
jgi:hypothetical protein